MPRFVHAADIHLDSPLKGLFHYEGAPAVEEIRGATRQAMDNLVNLVLSENIPLLIIAGDLYDGDWPDFNTGLYYARQMQKLGEAGVHIAVVRGNHDAANTMTKTLIMPENVKIFSAHRPETWKREDLGVAIHGQSYATRDVYDNLADGYPEPIPGMFNIGILHCLISGTEGHLPYAPCTMDELAGKGYDYWALGHVHEFGVLRKMPHIVYAGCTQGRHIREPGAKGCVLVEAEGGNLHAEFVALDVNRWVEVSVDVTDAETFEQAAMAFGEALIREMSDLEGRTACVRAVLTGRCPAHGRFSSDPETLAANIRTVAADVSGGNAWVEKVRLNTGPMIDFEELAASDTPQGGLLRYLKELSDNPGALKRLGLDPTGLKAKLSGSNVEIPDEDPDKLLADVRDILLTMLADEESLEGA